jgi:hypothetical protein
MTAGEDSRASGASGNEDRVSQAEGEVVVHRSSPGQAVFVEKGNSDAWISTDETVAVRR